MHFPAAVKRFQAHGWAQLDGGKEGLPGADLGLFRANTHGGLCKYCMYIPNETMEQQLLLVPHKEALWCTANGECRTTGPKKQRSGAELLRSGRGEFSAAAESVYIPRLVRTRVSWCPQVFVKAGSGGQGAATFKVLNGRQKGPPDGGSGGKGGDVVFVCYEKLNTLQAFKGRASFHAENGEDGDYSYRNGANGQGVEIQVCAAENGECGSRDVREADGVDLPAFRYPPVPSFMIRTRARSSQSYNWRVSGGWRPGAGRAAWATRPSSRPGGRQAR